MENQNKRLLQTASSFILLMIPVYVINIWTRSFNAGTSQEERVAIFKSNLPLPVDDMSDLNWILLGLVTVGMVLAAMARKNAGITYKLINTLLLAGGSLLFVLLLFWMM